MRRISTRVRAFGAAFLVALNGALAIAPMATAVESYTITNTVMVSKNDAGDAENLASDSPYVNSTGRYVAFSSASSNLDPAATSSHPQAFVRDIQAGTTTLVSIGSDGQPSNGSIYMNGFSADGRYVLFTSDATNMPDYIGDNATARFLYLRDRQQNTTLRLGNGAFTKGIGGMIVFAMDQTATYFAYQGITASGQTVAFVFDRSSNLQTQLPSNTTDIRVSKYSHYATYSAPATDDQGNALGVRNFRIDVASGQSQMLPASAPGRLILTDADHGLYTQNNQLLRYDLTTATSTLLYQASGSPTLFTIQIDDISSDANRIVLYYQDGNGGGLLTKDIRVYDVPSGQLIPITDRQASGAEASITADGTQVAYANYSTSADGNRHCYLSTIGIVVTDTTPPTTGPLTFSTNPLPAGQNTILSMAASDTETGIFDGEFFIGSDPGQGYADPLEWDGTHLTATFGSNLQPGSYQVSARARDNFNNWSAPTTATLTVTSSTGSVSGTQKKTFFEWLTNSGDPVNYTFAISYMNGTPSAQNTFQLSSATGLFCGTIIALNCQTYTVNATNIQWFVKDQPNDWRARVQGVASVTNNGTTTANHPFTLTAVDGNHQTPVASDTVTVKVYAPGANVASDTPQFTYQTASNSHGTVSIQ